MNVEPETLEHILAQPIMGRHRYCGCPTDPKAITPRRLCAYHAGYDEGIDLIRTLINPDIGPKSTNDDIDDEIEEAIQWRDWQTVEMLTKEMGTP